MSSDAPRLSPTETAQMLEDLALGEDYALTSEYVEMVVDAADRGDGLRLRELISALHPADVADLLGFLSAEHRDEVESATERAAVAAAAGNAGPARQTDRLGRRDLPRAPVRRRVQAEDEPGVATNQRQDSERKVLREFERLEMVSGQRL